MIQPRAADDFAMIRTRMKELRRERERAQAAEAELRQEVRCGRSERLPSEEISAGSGRVGQSGLGKQLDRGRPWRARPE